MEFHVEMSRKHKIIRMCYSFSQTAYFNSFISLSIILNTVVLSLDKYPEDDYSNMILEKINIVFFAIFFLEMIIKLIGHGFKRYIKEYFNAFDCIVVLLSCIDVILQLII